MNTGSRQVSGSFEAYRAAKEGSRARHPSRRGTAPPPSGRTRPSGPRRATPAPTRRPAPGRGTGAARERDHGSRPPARRAGGAGHRPPPERGGPVGRAPRPAPPHVVRRRMAVLPILSVLLFAAVTAKLVDVQVRNPDRYIAQGAQQRQGTATLPASRGAILDRNGEALALSVPRRTVFADPSLISDPEKVADLLAPHLDLPRAELVDALEGDGRFVVLQRTLPDDVADAVEALDLAGIGLYEEYLRVRPSDDVARSIVGGVTADGLDGTSGLEMQLDELLTGTPGELVFERSKADGGGTITGTRRQTEAARPGADVGLTLDLSLQYEAERILAQHLASAGAMGGTAIVSRPSTGEVLALANLEADDDGTGFVPSANNQALTTVYEPGSVNKVVTVAAAIEAGLVTPETTMEVPDHLQVGDHEFTDSHPHATTTWTVTDILATSSNVGTIMLAQRLGGARMDDFLRRFGFGEPTGLDFPAESAGIMLPREEWARQSTAIGSIPIGQSISVTALQMLQAFNVLANDGTYVPARLVREVTDADGRAREVENGDPRQVVSPSTAQAVRAMMAQVVSRGTGQLAAVPGYSVAGKTGTARKPQPGGGYEDEDGRYHYIATFAGLLPAENPDLSIIVVIDEPDPGRSIYAGDVAAPAFADLARVALRRLGIPPSVGGDITDVPAMSDSAVEIGDAPVPPPPTSDDDTTGDTTGDTASDETATDDDDGTGAGTGSHASADGVVAEGGEPADDGTGTDDDARSAADRATTGSG